MLLIVLPVGLHILAYPAFVWVVSKLFYEHAFRFNQTLQYGLITHLVELILIYSIPLLAFVSFGRRTPGKIETTNQSSKEERTPPSFMVTDGNKRLKIELMDIHYITANSPYSTIFCDEKKYLYNGSLKSVVGKVSGFGFVRIHKSTIVNIQFVHSYTSRLNGDYDVTMKDGSTLRVSRNYAAGFKAEFQQPHQDTTK